MLGLGLGLANVAFVTVSVTTLTTAATGFDVAVKVDLTVPATKGAGALEFFGVIGAIALATKYSCALKTFRHDPQRTEPLADCS